MNNDVLATGGKVVCMVCDKEFVWKYNFNKNSPMEPEYVKASLVVKNSYLDVKSSNVNVTVLEMIASVDCPNCGITNERYHTVEKNSLVIR
ncbi:hypothetical protein MKX40_17950 [Paenibacillus sp. FSL R5-0517]|uniref:hypothetical protein n=1 Tax=Paenibacillus sp. FSL R5-0517 TaxID=2921647 RepID=UPI0030DCB576